MADEKDAKDQKPEADAKAQSPKASKETKQPKEKKAKAAPKAEKVSDNPDFKYIVRIANTDLNGAKPVELALTGIRGVGDRMGTMLADHAGIDRRARIGDLTDAQIEQLAKAAEEAAANVPAWAVNRPFDVESGDDLHLIGADIQTVLRDDLNRLKKIRSYRGIRHETGQKVRGQRTRSNGRTGLTIGVVRSKEERDKQAAASSAAAAAPAKTEGGA